MILLQSLFSGLCLILCLETERYCQDLLSSKRVTGNEIRQEIVMSRGKCISDSQLDTYSILAYILADIAVQFKGKKIMTSCNIHWIIRLTKFAYHLRGAEKGDSEFVYRRRTVELYIQKQKGLEYMHAAASVPIQCAGS